MKRNVYLQMVSIKKAIEIAKNSFDAKSLIKAEFVPSQEAVCRVTSEPICALFSSPNFHCAAMDGYAVRAIETFEAREGAPICISKENCFAVNTGNPLPENTDAVIMIEQIISEDDKEIKIEKPAFPMQHVRKIGEDIVATELLFPQNHTISAYDIGALLSAGIWDIKVWEKVRIAIIPTGDEILDFAKKMTAKRGEVIESNSQVFRALGENLGCICTRLYPVKDNEESLSKAILEALEGDYHIIAIGAGSSAGSKDYTSQIIQKYGEILVHGIKIMPGKPSILGKIKDKIIIGTPGYPVSAVVCFEELLKPIISWLSKRQFEERIKIRAILTRKIPSKLGMEELIRLSIGRVNKSYVATPLRRGAGLVTSLTKAQGMTRIPAQVEGIEAGRTVNAELFVPKQELEKTVIIVGSHDNTLDLLQNELMGMEDYLNLVSSHVGSTGGILALKSGTTLLAGMHLFDEKTLDYNFPFLKKYMPNIEICAVNLAIRQQGLIVPKGNPKNIKDIEDLIRSDIKFINRQRGSGTRVLFDYYLAKKNIKPEQIEGYLSEEFTHMAVAANVLTGSASCGFGIYASAKALELDFIPFVKERYDLVFRKELENESKIQAILSLIRTKEFIQKIEELGGYETKLTGKIMLEGMGLDLH